jgi:hypothetical protein
MSCYELLWHWVWTNERPSSRSAWFSCRNFLVRLITVACFFLVAICSGTALAQQLEWAKQARGTSYGFGIALDSSGNNIGCSRSQRTSVTKPITTERRKTRLSLPM